MPYADQPLVSVIIPTWNRRHSLQAAVRSVLGQTHANVEVLVCDDGSTDDSRDAMEALRDPRIRWITGPRAGLPSIPRNRGMGLAQGEWIAFLDSDDLWYPEKLSSQLATLRATGGLAACANADRHMGDGHLTGQLLQMPATDVRIGLDSLFKTNSVITSSAIIHRSLLPLAEGFPITPKLKVGEDYAFWLRIATQAEFNFSARSLVIYSDSPQTSVRNDSRNESIAKLRVLFNYFDWYAGVDLGRCIPSFTRVMSYELIRIAKLLTKMALNKTGLLGRRS